MRPENMASSRTSSTTRSIWSRLWPKRQVSVADIRRSQTVGVVGLFVACIAFSLNLLIGTGLHELFLLGSLAVGASTWRSCSEVKECRQRMPGSLYQWVESFRGAMFVLGVFSIMSALHFFPFESELALLTPLAVYVWFAASIGWWLVNDSVLARFTEGG